MEYHFDVQATYLSDFNVFLDGMETDFIQIPSLNSLHVTILIKVLSDICNHVVLGKHPQHTLTRSNYLN